MGLEDILGKEIEGARQLGEDYWKFADEHGLDHIAGAGYFLILANERLSEDADHRKNDTPPWPGIKMHSPLSAEMYNVLESNDFKKMLENGEIDGIKVYLYGDDKVKHKEVTIYISPYSMPNLGNLLDILKNNGISIQPALSSYYDQRYEMVLLNRMPIAPDAGIFARYSTDFTGKMNISDIKNIKDSMMANIDITDINQVRMIDDYIIDMYRSKIDDHVWRVAADESIPRIVAVSRSWLLNNKYNLDKILRNSYVSLKDFYYELWKNADPKELLRYLPTIPTIYTFITLKRINRETIVPNPNIILSYDDYNKQLEAYNVLDARRVELDLSSEESSEHPIISDHPKKRLEKFLKNGTAYP